MKNLIYGVLAVYALYYVLMFAYDMVKGGTIKASTAQGFDSFEVAAESQTATVVTTQEYSDDKKEALAIKEEGLKKKD